MAGNNKPHKGIEKTVSFSKCKAKKQRRMRGKKMKLGRGQVFIERRIREDLTKRVTTEQRPEWGKKKISKISVKMLPGKAIQCKTLEKVKT